jgi:hypothetical protein
MMLASFTFSRCAQAQLHTLAELHCYHIVSSNSPSVTGVFLPATGRLWTLEYPIAFQSSNIQFNWFFWRNVCSICPMEDQKAVCWANRPEMGQTLPPKMQQEGKYGQHHSYR